MRAAVIHAARYGLGRSRPCEERGAQHHGEEDEEETGHGHGEESLGSQRIGSRFLAAGDQDHDGEHEEHGDGARVHDDLGGGQELRAHLEEERGESGQVHHQEQRAVDRVPAQDHARRGGDGQHREDPESDLAGRRHEALRITGMGRSAGMGTREVGTPFGPAGSRDSSTSFV